MANLKVNISDQRAGNAGLNPGNISAQAFGSEIGEGISALGRGMGAMIDAQRQKEEQQENILIAKQDATDDAFWTRKLEIDKANAQPGADGFTERQAEEFRSYREGVLSSLPNERARQRADLNLERLSGRVAADAIKFEAVQRVAKVESDVDEVVNMRRNTVQGNPNRYQEVLKQSVNDVIGAGLRGDKLLAKVTEVKRGVAQSAAQGMIERDPNKALELLNGGMFDKEMAPEAKAVLVNQAQSAIRQKEVLSRQASGEARIAMSSVKERMVAGETIPAEEMAYVSQTVGAASNPQLAEQFQVLQETQSFTQKYTKMSPQELQSEVIGLREKANKDGVSASLSNQMDIAEKSLDKMVAAVRDDRISYAARTGITDVGSITDEEGGISPAGITKRLAAAEQLDQHFGFRGDLLTKPEAESIVSAMNTGTAEEQLARVQSLAQAFGARTGDVFRQISAKDQSIAYIAGLAVENPSAARKALEGRRIARENPKGANLGEGAEGQITNALRDKFGDMLRFAQKHEASVRATAIDIYRYDASTSPSESGDFKADVYEKAIAQAVNAKIETIGGGETLVPNDVDVNEFESLISNATPEVLQTHSISGNAPYYATGKLADPAELKDARFYPVDDGRYVVKGPTGFWMDGSNLYVFDVRGKANVGQ